MPYSPFGRPQAGDKRQRTPFVAKGMIALRGDVM